MKGKILLPGGVLILLLTVSAFGQSTRTDAEFVKEAMSTFELNSVRPAFVEAERMGENYRFYPAVRGGRVAGYLWWAKDFRIANHYEDIILLVRADGSRAKLVDFWIAHNDHHLNMSEEATRRKFSGMTYDADWDENVDTISGSTLSSYQVMAAAKTTLFVFEKYVIETGLLK